MIVFTATNNHTQDVYVGTAKESVEEEWADLLSQADGGASGQFFEQLRAQGSDGFEVDTWAYGETSAEARESMREAREDLGAQPIKSSRGKSAGRSTGAIQSASMKALMAAFEEATSDDSDVDLDDLDGIEVSSKKETKTLSSGAIETSDGNQAIGNAQLRPESSLAGEQAAPVLETRNPASNPTNTAADDETKMSARLEAMKAAQEKLLRERAAQPDALSMPIGSRSAGAKSSAEATPMKMATGRTGSTAKEKRIREAVEAERERRENLRHTNNREDQAAMNVVMARIELRRLATKKANAEKAKVNAAARRAKNKAIDAAEADSSTKSPVRRRKTTETPTKTTDLVKPAAPVKTAGPAKAASSQRQEAKPVKLAVGRTGSSAKEKRIKEAIEMEKAERLGQQQSQRAEEAKEMAAILARLEERTKAAEKIKRKR